MLAETDIVSEKTYHLVELGVQIAGLLYFIWRVGRYTGAAEAGFKQIVENQKAVKDDLDKHVEEDREFQGITTSTLTKIQVSVASISPSRGGRAQGAGDGS